MKQVLYVEDSATSQLLMRKYLQSACELTITPSPRTGLTLTQERNFDLVVTDYLFPDGDALDMITRLRQARSKAQLPIVVISSSMDATLLNRVLKAGANDGMAKPLPTVEFRALIERMLKDAYVRTPEKSITSVACFQWAQQGEFHELCPELDIHLSGSDRDDVNRRMSAAIREQLAQGAALGFTTQEKIFTHVVEP
jgi:CheY-like chemotaxis protein